MILKDKNGFYYFQVTQVIFLFKNKISLFKDPIFSGLFFKDATEGAGCMNLDLFS